MESDTTLGREKEISMVFELAALFPTMTVQREPGFWPEGEKKVFHGGDDRGRVDVAKVIERSSQSRLVRNVSELSGGQRQQVRR